MQHVSTSYNSSEYFSVVPIHVGKVHVLFIHSIIKFAKAKKNNNNKVRVRT